MSLRVAAVLVTAAAGCGFHPGGDPADAGIIDDGGNRTITLRADTAADFMIPGTVHEALVIEPWGALAPAAYHAGGLLSHASNTQRFSNAIEATWAQVVDGDAAGTGFMTRSLSGDPPGVGLDSGDSWTYWAEGEIWLEAGTTTFLIDADDAGFIDIASPGGDFARVVSATQGISTGAITVAAAGWYPIRLAASEGFGSSELVVQLFAGNGGGSAELLGPARLRTRVDGLRGTVLAAWDNTMLVGQPHRTLATDTLVDADFGNGTPYDVGITNGDNWSARWSGQFYVTMSGSYRLRVVSDDGHRLYVGKAVVSDVLADTAADRTVDVELVAGWNDLVLDLNELTGDASALLEVVAGPEPGLEGGLPATRLRPLEPRGERVESAGEDDDITIPDGDLNGAVSAVDLGGLRGATVASVDVVVNVDHARIADLQIRLIHPGGDEVVLRNNSDLGGNGNRVLRFTTEIFDDTAAAGEWRVKVSDTVSTTAGTIRDVQLAVHLANGPDQVARSAAFTSLVQDLGADVVSIDTVRFGGRAPSPAGIAVRLRGCDAPEQCAAAAWSEPITDGGGGAAGITVTRYLQYRVELTSDGEREPELDWLELDYRAPAP